jgi:hypothetical protein
MKFRLGRIFLVFSKYGLYSPGQFFQIGQFLFSDLDLKIRSSQLRLVTTFITFSLFWPMWDGMIKKKIKIKYGPLTKHRTVLNILCKLVK